MKLHVSPTAVWLPLLVLALLVLGFLAMMLIAEPGARIPR